MTRGPRGPMLMLINMLTIIIVSLAYAVMIGVSSALTLIALDLDETNVVPWITGLLWPLALPVIVGILCVEIARRPKKSTLPGARVVRP